MKKIQQHLRQRFSWIVVEQCSLEEVLSKLKLKKTDIGFWGRGYYTGTRDNSIFALSIGQKRVMLCGCFFKENTANFHRFLGDDLRLLSDCFGKACWFGNQCFIGSNASVGQYGWAVAEKGVLKRHYVYEFTTSNVYEDIGTLLPIEVTIKNRLSQQGFSTVGHGTLQTDDVISNADIVFEIAKSISGFDVFNWNKSFLNLFRLGYVLIR